MNYEMTKSIKINDLNDCETVKVQLVEVVSPIETYV